MKRIRTALVLLTVAAILFASSLSAKAIGFDAEKSYESVFVIYCGNSLGSGFAVGENCIVTNAHVVDSMGSITVVTYEGKEYPASLVGMNEREDIAVLAVAGAKFPYLELADLTTMKLGDDIYTIGAPKGMSYTLTKGGISAKERDIGGQTYIQIDAPINEGNSGGPLLNDAGQVLGMNTLKMTDSEGIGLAIPVDRVCSYIASLGIELDDGGNVAGTLDADRVPEEETPSETYPPKKYKNEEDDRREDAKIPPITYLAFFVAGLSLLGNVAMAVLLIQKNKKPKPIPYDPSERTDFEIEIWE